VNEIGRNCLLGHRNKITKFLMRIFTCRSTFLYGDIIVSSHFGAQTGKGTNYYEVTCISKKRDYSQWFPLFTSALQLEKESFTITTWSHSAIIIVAHAVSFSKRRKE
jgi:hypothetical protein